jgi:hypothetical protein
MRVQVWDIDPASRQLMADGFVDVANPCLRTPGAPCQIEHERGPLILTFDRLGAEASPRPLPAPPDATAPGGGGPPGVPAPNAAAVDAALRLRDRDTCTGADQFMPGAAAFVQSPMSRQLPAEQANRVYQAATFAMAITNAATKQAVLNDSGQATDELGRDIEDRVPQFNFAQTKECDCDRWVEMRPRLLSPR